MPFLAMTSAFVISLISRVTFTLIDQCQDTDTRKNITYTVKPNIVNENKVSPSTFGQVPRFLLQMWFRVSCSRGILLFAAKKTNFFSLQAFLGRPTAERNASFGATKFVEIETLNTLDYVKDDCLFVKVVVDSEDMICL